MSKRQQHGRETNIPEAEEEEGDVILSEDEQDENEYFNMKSESQCAVQN